MPRDFIRLVNMDFYAYHGATPEEATLGQRFQVDVALEVDLEEAGRSDDLARTVDYREVHRMVAQIVQGERCSLLEALAWRIVTCLLERFPRVEAVQVRVRKPSVPLGGLVGYAEVEITRRREE